MRRAAAVAVLLVLVAAGQAAAVVSRLDGGEVEAIRPGTERVVSDDLLTGGRVVRATVERDSYRPPTHALYGESHLGDPLEGRVLAVGTGFHDNWPVFPGPKTPGFRMVDLGGRKAAVGRDRAWTWATWDLPDCTDECQRYVAGRNLPEEDVLRAARGATADSSTAVIAADALPGGLSLIVSGRVDLDGFWAPGAQNVTRWVPDGGLVLRVIPDARLAPLLRFWIEGGPTPIRGQAGAAGGMASLGEGGPYHGRAWAEGGRALIIVSSRLPGSELDRFVRGLRSAGPGEWDRVRRRVLDISSETAIEGCYDPGDAYVALGRHEGRYRWAVGVQVDDRGGFRSCHVIVTPDHRSLGSRGGPRSPGPLSLAMSGIGGATDPVGLFVIGIAPPGTATVRAELADGGTVDAELAATGPAPGERYFAAWVEGDVRRKLAVAALDASGRELARYPGGDPR